MCRTLKSCRHLQRIIHPLGGRIVVWLVFFILSSTTILFSQVEKMVVEVYPLGLQDFETAEILAKGLMSSDAKLVADRTNHRLILLDYPEKQQALSAALTKVQFTSQNVRIKVAFKDHRSIESENLGGQARYRVGGVEITTTPHHSETQIRARTDQVALSSLIQQELLVISGGRGNLIIATEVPYEEWFWTYGVQQGWWGASSIRWKEVGAKLIVEPYVMGNRIRVRLTPEFSYLLDSRRLTVAVEQLTTEVIVENGQEIDLGGLPIQDREFYSRFLIGYDIARERRSLNLTLTPTIENIQDTYSTDPTSIKDSNIGSFRKNTYPK